MSYFIKKNGLQLKTDDGRDILGFDVGVQIKEVDELKRTFWATASSEVPDRDKDIIRADSWNLKNYKKNPVGLWAHDYYEHPHFKTEKIIINRKDKTVEFKPIFDTHDRANISFNQYKNGFMQSFSVGFIPGEFAYRNDDDKWGGGREFTKNTELLEISCVPVPAHPDARIHLNNLGLLPEAHDLITLGFSFESSTRDNTIWIPTNKNLDAFKDPRLIKITTGITAVSAVPLFESIDKEEISPVGYLFDPELYNEEKIGDWLKANNINTSELTRKYYVIGFDENNNISMKIEEEIIVDKSDSDAIVVEEDESEEDGCGGRRKPKKEEEDSFNEEKDFVVEDYDELIDSKDYLGELEKPFPNEHACRLKDPAGFDSFARKNCAAKVDDKCIDFIYGIKDGKSTLQTMRYKKSIWDASAAKEHCKNHNGTFEAASSESQDSGIKKYLVINANVIDDEGKILETKEIKISGDLTIIDIEELNGLKSRLSSFDSELKEIKLMLQESKQNSDTPSADELDLLEFDVNEFTPVSQKASDSEKIEITVEEVKSAVFGGFGNFFSDALKDMVSKRD